MKDDKQQILSLEEEQVDTFNRGDIDGLLSFFDPNLTGFSSTKHMRLASLGELRKTFEYYRDLGQNVSYIISDPCIEMFGDTAILSFYWNVQFGGGKKRKSPIEGRGTHVYVRRDAGWKIVHEHFSRAHRSYEKK